MFRQLLVILLGLITALSFNTTAFASIEEEKKQEAKAEESSLLKGSATIINIKSDEVEYFQEKDQFVATGNVIITVEDDGTIIKSEEVIYDRTNEIIISKKDVRIFKRDTIIDGDYARFDLTKKSALISNPDTYLRQIKINATKAIVHSEDMELLKGKATLLEKDMVLVLSAGSMGAQKKDFFQKRPDAKPRLNYDIKAKEIIVEDMEYRKIVTMRNAQISINRFKIAKIPELKMTSAEEAGYLTFKRNKKTGMPTLQLETVKKTNRIETMLPEFGHRRELGSYIGHGQVFNLPKGSTLKALPIFTFGDGDGASVGVGGMARFMSSSNETELLYSTLRNKFVLEGEQRILTPFTKIQYSAFSFIDNGFFGRQKPAYLIEAVDHRKLFEAYNMKFSLRSTAGMVEQIENNFATGRFQLQGYLNNIEPLWNYEEYLTLGFDSNFHIGVYGTGDTYGIIRAGPTAWSILGPFKIWAAYYQGAIQGETPFLFDEYRYGKSNVVFNGSVDVTDFLAIGYRTSLNLSRDNWEKELVTENQLYVYAGPSDLKFKIGYDVVRARTVFGFDMLVGSETSALEFEKLRVIQR